MPSVQPLDEVDLELVIENIHWGKLSQTINHLLWNDWPNKEAQREQTAQHVKHSFRDPSVSMLKAADDVSGEFLGFIVLTPRLSTKRTEMIERQSTQYDADEKRPKLSDQLNPQILSLAMQGLGEITKAMAGRDYIEITSIIVLPPSRNKGIGKQLMVAAFDRAKSNGLSLFLNCETQAQGFFEKLGMRQAEHVDIELSEYAPPYSGFGRYRMVGMVWPPEG